MWWMGVGWTEDEGREREEGICFLRWVRRGDWGWDGWMAEEGGRRVLVWGGEAEGRVLNSSRGYRVVG